MNTDHPMNTTVNRHMTQDDDPSPVPVTSSRTGTGRPASCATKSLDGRLRSASWT